MKDREYIKTSNLNVASTLYSIGIPIDGIHAREDSPAYDFYFLKSSKTEKAMEDFFSGRLRVEPKGLFNCRNDILDRLKEQQRKNEKST